MKKLYNQLNIKVIHRAVDVVVIRYNRHNGCDSYVYDAIAVYERHYRHIPDDWYWNEVYSTYPIETDAYDHSSMDYPKWQKLLTRLSDGQNSYTIKSYKLP